MIFDKLRALPPDSPPWIVDHQPVIVAAHDETIAPGTVADAAARTATALRANGVTAGTRCLVWLDTPTDIIVAYAAITALDAVPVLISTTLPGPTLKAMVAGVPGITTAIATDERLAEASTLLPDLAHLDWRAIAAELPASAPYTRPKEVASHDPYVIVHTSGTTGVPKLVECSSRSIRFNASVQAVIHRVSRLRGHLCFAISPVHGRTVVGILAALTRKAPLMLPADHSASNIERLLERHRPEYLETHPNTFRAWQHLAPGGAFRSVRFFGAGFDVLHPDTVRALLAGSARRFPLCVEVYGQNESGPVAIRCHVKGFRGRTTKLGGHRVGPRFFFCRVRILDDDGTPVPAGTPGRIVVRSPGTFSGYPNRPELSSRDYPRGRWWDTGDWGAKSRLGFLTLIDRKVDRVAAAPSAIAIENVLLDQFPEFLELVVIDVDGTARPVLSLRPGATFRWNDWTRAVRRVGGLAEPVVIPDGEFPRTVTGKVQRAQLADMIRRQHAVTA